MTTMNVRLSYTLEGYLDVPDAYYASGDTSASLLDREWNLDELQHIQEQVNMLVGLMTQSSKENSNG